MMRNLILILTMILPQASCSTVKNTFENISGRNKVEFDGKRYRARLQAEDDRKTFAVTVNRVSQGLQGAREAGRLEATEHCIKYFGSSDVDWTAGPDVTDEELVVVDDTITFAGACKGW